jgi:hypothetical protein
MEVFFYRRQVMRVAIVHIGHGPDDRDPFAQPPPYGAAADRKPVLVQLGDGMPNLYILLNQTPAILRASSLLSNLAADRRPGSSSK